MSLLSYCPECHGLHRKFPYECWRRLQDMKGDLDFNRPCWGWVDSGKHLQIFIVEQRERLLLEYIHEKDFSITNPNVLAKIRELQKRGWIRKGSKDGKKE